ncbi:MAG TPA: ketopantoate reductase family protein [Actinomycetota bacterium]|nr:ketopantoate reductase family protein [Actinomycetota bacterium]
MKVLIVGIGGVGGYVGARLQAAGHEVSFLARGENLRALRTTGLRLESDHGDVTLAKVRAVVDGTEAGPVDAAIFCVKAYDDEPAADVMAGAVAPGTSITSLQNGVENESFLSARFPSATILGGVARIEAWREAPGEFRQRGPQNRLLVGAFRPEDAPAAEALSAAFAPTGIEFVVAKDVESELWFKLMSICAVGGVTAFCRCTIGEARTDERLRGMMVATLEEAQAVATARGIALPRDPIPRLLAYYDDVLDGRLKSSMCRDVEAGRPLEVWWLNGAAVRFGEQAGVPTPVNRAILDALLPLHEAAMAARAAR